MGDCAGRSETHSIAEHFDATKYRAHGHLVSLLMGCRAADALKMWEKAHYQVNCSTPRDNVNPPPTAETHSGISFLQFSPLPRL
jgi:hypothetical protein